MTRYIVTVPLPSDAGTHALARCEDCGVGLLIVPGTTDPRRAHDEWHAAQASPATELAATIVSLAVDLDRSEQRNAELLELVAELAESDHTMRMGSNLCDSCGLVWPCPPEQADRLIREL